MRSPKATSGLNALQRVGGSIGTALLAVALSQQISHLGQGPAGGLPDVRSALIGASGQPAVAAAPPALE